MVEGRVGPKLQAARIEGYDPKRFSVFSVEAYTWHGLH